MIPSPPKNSPPTYTLTKPQSRRFVREGYETHLGTQSNSVRTSPLEGHNPTDETPIENIASSSTSEVSASNRSIDVQASARESAIDPMFAHREMVHCFESLMTTPFQAVLVEEQAASIPNTIVSNAQTRAAAVVGICRISLKIFAQQFLQTFAKKLKGALPIIMLCIDEGCPVDLEEFLDARRDFCRLGASDTMLQRSRGQKLILDVTLVAKRIWNNVAKYDAVQRRMQEKLYDLDEEKFWPYCHVAVEGFPQLEEYRPCLAIGSLVASRLILNEVSHGSFGKIFKCVKRSNGCVQALKVMHKSQLIRLPQIKAVASEIASLQKLNHPNVVTLHSAIHALDYIILVMDFAGDFNLFRYMNEGRLGNGQAGDILCQVVSGIGHCHRAGVAHRDLKPENIVVGDYYSHLVSFKIVGFGCAIETSKVCTDSCGTLPFVAPEVFLRGQGEPYNPTCVDMWACGITFLELLCGGGKLDELLQREPSSLDKHTYAVNLKSLFVNPDKAWEFVERDISTSWDHSMPGGPKVPFLGMLTVPPTLRWNAEQVGCWTRPWRKAR